MFVAILLGLAAGCALVGAAVVMFIAYVHFLDGLRVIRAWDE